MDGIKDADPTMQMFVYLPIHGLLASGNVVGEKREGIACAIEAWSDRSNEFTVGS